MTIAIAHRGEPVDHKENIGGRGCPLMRSNSATVKGCREVFSAARGRGAHVNHELVSCAPGAGLVGGLLLSELAGTACWPGFTQMVRELSRRECVTRVMGSSALSLASLGAGRATGVVLGGYDPVDVGAGVLIARESGAVVRAGRAASRVLRAPGVPGHDLLGHDLLLAAAPNLVGELVDVIDLAMGSEALD